MNREMRAIDEKVQQMKSLKHELSLLEQSIDKKGREEKEVINRIFDK